MGCKSSVTNPLMLGAEARVCVRHHSSRSTTTFTSSTGTKPLQRSCYLIVVLSKCGCIRTTELCNGLLDGLEAPSGILPWES